MIPRTTSNSSNVNARLRAEAKHTRFRRGSDGTKSVESRGMMFKNTVAIDLSQPRPNHYIGSLNSQRENAGARSRLACNTCIKRRMMMRPAQLSLLKPSAYCWCETSGNARLTAWPTVS